MLLLSLLLLLTPGVYNGCVHHNCSCCFQENKGTDFTMHNRSSAQSLTFVILRYLLLYCTCISCQRCDVLSLPVSMHVQIVAVVPRYVMVNHLSQALEVCQASAIIAASTSYTTSAASSQAVVIPSKGQTAFYWSQPIRKKKSKQVCMSKYIYVYLYCCMQTDVNARMR
jgi:hypothetical protein